MLYVLINHTNYNKCWANTNINEVLSDHSVKKAVFIHLKNCTNCQNLPVKTICLIKPLLKLRRERYSDCNNYYTQLFTNCLEYTWTSLVVQWLRIRLPMQGTRSIPGPGRSHMERSNCSTLSPRAATTEALEPMLCNKRSRCSEMPMHGN